MPRRAKELTALAVKKLRRPGMHAVGGAVGLYLQIQNEQARSWILRIKVADRRRDFGLGSYPDVSLALARQKARDLREQLTKGMDPVAKRRQERAKQITDDERRRLTFEQAARACHAARVPEFKSRKHRKDWISSLELHAFDAIGKVPVVDVELEHVRRVLDPIWQSRTETATRVRQRIETTLEWARAAGYRNGGNNPARWKGNLDMLLPRPSKIRRVKHHAALPWTELPEFMAALRQREGMGARALEFAILTAARSGEVRLATWQEIDLEERLWTVPAERMKAGKQHRVPLSPQAIKLLKSLPRMEGSEYVFTSSRGKPLSDMSLSAVCRRMKVSCVPHGFRSSFKDWARSATRYPDEVSELALSHVSSDATRAAYARDMLLEQRRKLLRAWARFVSEKSTA